MNHLRKESKRDTYHAKNSGENEENSPKAWEKWIENDQQFNQQSAAAAAAAAATTTTTSSTTSSPECINPGKNEKMKIPAEPGISGTYVGLDCEYEKKSLIILLFYYRSYYVQV